ncbi:DUF4376 domain-containing protein [uncultured Agrobacterium sp.]|uniref:DUF4376 domain-containing protein n=1 Tax=uncultured Agrobacterium sp. TaxID=157277 RepID=UPI0025E49E2F|nr:DUF4376 domain-containing protein [uncultured Agrobacterium sp.]
MNMMNEKGFYHPSIGYWQTITSPRDDVIANFPAGTIPYPLKPGANFEMKDGGWVATVLSKDELIDYSSNKRWEKENGGFEVGNMHIATDDRSKTMITGARVKADNDPSFTIPWKTPDGTFTRINATQIIAISNAMLDHVAACFDTEELVASQIMSGNITTFEQIETAWNS